MGEEVSVIVPCYNAGRFLRETVRGLKSQTFPFKEILIVDDGSSDETAKMAKELGCVVHRHPSNQGLASARNTGIVNAQSNLVACVDADVVLDANWLATLLPKLADPRFVQAGGRIIENNQASAADRWRALHMKLDYGAGPRSFDKQTPGRLSGFATLAKREALQMIGLYDCKFGRSYEDVDVSTRLIDHGFALYYEPRALCYHFRRDTIRSLLASTWSWSFWPARFQGSYDSGRALRAKIGSNVATCLQLSAEHVASRDYRLLGIDGSLLFMSSFWDMKYFLSSHFSWARAILGPSHLGNVGSASRNE